MKEWLSSYINSQISTLEYLPIDDIDKLIWILQVALSEEKNIFVFGNGGSAANASHFATDLGKGASDKLDSRFRIMALTDNVGLITAIANDYDYTKTFMRQMMNFARRGDIAIGLSVSGNSENCQEALKWATKNGLYTVAFTGAKDNKMADISDLHIRVNSNHYGIVEDAHMTICHMITNYFMEEKEPRRSGD